MAAHVHTGQDTIYRLSRRSFPQIIRIRTVGARAVNKRREIMALSLVVYRIQIQIPHDPFCILCISQRNITFPKMYESLIGVVFLIFPPILSILPNECTKNFKNVEISIDEIKKVDS